MELEKGIQIDTDAENGMPKCVHTCTQRQTQTQTHDHALRGQCGRAVAGQVFSSIGNSRGAHTDKHLFSE